VARVAGRTPTDTRRLLLEGGRTALTEAIQNSPPGGLVSMSMKYALERANDYLQSTEPGAKPLTVGAVRSAFGSREDYTQAVLSHMVRLETGGDKFSRELAQISKREIVDVEAELDRLADADLENMIADDTSVRLWLLALASSGSDEEFRRLCAEVYREFDAALIPVYILLGSLSSREPTATWRDLAANLTAITEGFALRWIGDPGRQERLFRLHREARRCLWYGLTRPVSEEATSAKGDPEASEDEPERR
jgi:hypothetical protein